LQFVHYVSKHYKIFQVVMKNKLKSGLYVTVVCFGKGKEAGERLSIYSVVSKIFCVCLYVESVHTGMCESAFVCVCRVFVGRETHGIVVCAAARDVRVCMCM